MLHIMVYINNSAVSSSILQDIRKLMFWSTSWLATPNKSDRKCMYRWSASVKKGTKVLRYLSLFFHSMRTKHWHIPPGPHDVFFTSVLKYVDCTNNFFPFSNDIYKHVLIVNYSWLHMFFHVPSLVLFPGTFSFHILWYPLEKRFAMLCYANIVNDFTWNLF